jgi:hypothetical protein
MNSLAEDRYMQRDGTWGDYRTRARFASHRAADRFMEAKGIEVYGIFP